MYKQKLLPLLKGGVKTLLRITNGMEGGGQTTADIVILFGYDI